MKTNQLEIRRWAAGTFAVLTFAVMPVWAQTTVETEEKEKKEKKDADLVMLDAFEVSSEKDYGYRATNAGSVTGIGTAIADTPFSVAVLTSEFIEDKGADELNQIVRNVSSMSSTTKDEHEIYARGFLSVIKVDGGEENRGAFSLDSADRIEVTKGPASILQGRASAGGVVNIIGKKPSFNPRTNVKATVGSWNHRKFSLDSTGPLVSDKLAYRVVYAKTDEDGWVEHTYKDEYNYLAGIKWRPIETMEITVSTKYSERERGNAQHVTMSHPAFLAADLAAIELYDNQGLPRPAGYPQINQTVRSWLNSHPDYGPNEPAETVIAVEDVFPEGYQANMQGPQQFRYIDSGRHMAEMRWHINDWLDFKGSYYESDYSKQNADISTFRANGGLLIRQRSVMPFSEGKRSFYQGDFAAQFEFLNTRHRLLLGHQYRDFTNRSATLRTDVVSYNPRTEGERYIVDEIAAANGGVIDPPWSNWSQGGHERATYLVDVIEAWEERLHVMLGARHTHRFQGTVREWKITPQYGAVWKVPGLNGLSVYASYAESFTPNFTRDAFGNLIDPREEVNVEGGFKLDLWDGKLTGTASIFNLEQRNVALRDYAEEAEQGISPIYIFSGLARSEGAEMDLVYTPMRNYQVMLSWSRLWEARTVEAQDQRQVGVRLDGAPEYTFSFWNKYTFLDGPLKNFYLGAGLRHTGPIHVHPSWSVTIFSEPYWYADLLVGYRWKPSSKTSAEVSLRVENMLDEEYLDGSFRPSEPIRGYLSARYSF